MKRAFVVLALAGLLGPVPWPAPAEAETPVAAARRQERRERWRQRREARLQARQQDAEEWRSACGGLSAPHRATLVTTWVNAVERLEPLTPEQKRQLVEAAERLGGRLRNLSPEERARL